MNSTPSSQPVVENPVPSAVLPPAVHPTDTGFHRASSAENISASAKLGPRRIGYGLPCVKCKTYYAADLSACPVCKTKERVLPLPLVTANSSGRLPEPVAPGPDEIALEEERERFLREFKARVYESDSQMDDELDTHIGLHAPGCSLEASHQGSVEPATVCQGCYARLQGKIDLLEAALHIDLKDATQLIYDAVWSEPSDPSKTYHNAARAILGELRKRAGISAVLGPFKPLAH